jgi:hypothetical protein
MMVCFWQGGWIEQLGETRDYQLLLGGGLEMCSLNLLV